MKINVKDATGDVLDWLVAKCEGVVLEHGLTDDERYSTNPAQGHPIIERERISSIHTFFPEGWECRNDVNAFARGPTALIAAMRCYVVSKLGYEVEVPDELFKEI